MARAETSGFANLVAPGLRKVYFDTLMDIPKEFRQFMNVLPPRPSSRSGLHYFDDLRVSSLGSFALKPEGVPIQYDVPIEDQVIRYEPFTFGLGFRITEEMQEDDLYGVMTRMTQQLSMSAAFTVEVQAHRVLNNAFGVVGGGSGHRATGFDGVAVPLISTAHTRIRGGNRANALASAADLGVTSLEQMMNLFDNWTNHSGMPTPRKGSILVVGPNLRFIAKQLTESELEPYTGNNEVNPFGGEGLRYIVSHYLTDPDSWYLLSPKAQHDLLVWMRRAPKFSAGDDFDTGDAKAKGTFRMASGHGEPDGIAGSPGVP